MKKQDAEHIITEYVKPVYGFALKRCKTPEDAEDLSQEIILKAFRALLAKEDIRDVGKFLWTIAHNTLSNYYRAAGRFCTGGPVEELAEVLPDGKQDLLAGLVEQETAAKLQSEIAYLSKLQLRDTMYEEAAKQSKYYDSMANHFCGACWNQVGKLTLWQVDSEWSEKRIDNWYHQEVQKALVSMNHMVAGEELSKDEYAYLAEKGLVKTLGSPDGLFKAAWQCVWLEGTDIKNELLALGDRLREKYQTVFQELQKPYVDAVRRATPKHLHTMLNYGLQYTFYWDGWFILHCMKTLVENGKLLPPREHQRKALTTIIIHE